MHCPNCKSPQSKVIDSRTVNRNSSIRRRRECLECAHRYTTYEYIMSQPLIVVKKDGRRADYDRDRIDRSFRIACNKRPVSAERIESSINHIQKQIEDSGKTEIPTSEIGDIVMGALKELDKVAYIRFASVYREFADIGAFKAEIDLLQE